MSHPEPPSVGKQHIVKFEMKVYLATDVSKSKSEPLSKRTSSSRRREEAARPRSALAA